MRGYQLTPDKQLLLDRLIPVTISRQRMRQSSAGRRSDRMALRFVLMAILAVSIFVNGQDNSTEQQLNDAMQEVSEHCFGHYTPGCVQFKFLSGLERILSTADYEVLPGVYLSRQNSTVDLPASLLSPGRQLETTTQVLNSLLAEKMFDQLRTWSLKVFVFSNGTLDQFKSVMDLYLSDQGVETGRKASKFWKYMGGALVTVAFSVLSALISKALTLSIIALALTLLGNAGAGFGFGFGSPRPAASYRSPPPIPLRSHVSHASELQYVDEMADDGGQPYVYVNRKSYKTGRSDDDYDMYYRNYNKHQL